MLEKYMQKRNETMVNYHYSIINFEIKFDLMYDQN
jgi:hypothetical protein